MTRFLQLLPCFVLLCLAQQSCVSPSPHIPMEWEPLVYLEQPPESPSRKTFKATLPISETSIHLLPFPVFTHSDILHTGVAGLPMGQCLMIQLNPKSAEVLRSISTKAGGRRLVIAIGNRFLGARPLSGTITDGVLLIFLEVPDQELHEIVKNLNRLVSPNP